MDTVRQIPAPRPDLYRVSALDVTAVVLYVAVPLAYGLAAGSLLPFLRQVFPNPAAATFFLNVLVYLSVGIPAFVAARHVVVRDLRVLATRPWFTLMMVPLALIAMVIFTSILVSLAGSLEGSVNQQRIQSLMLQVPAWLMVPLLVVVGPFVEEYLFRHLLIGKLSQRINIWVCCALSVVVFAAIHVVGREDLRLDVLLPYLGMGAALVFVYVWTGRNLMFSYFVHAAKNLLAVVVFYAIPPELMEQFQQLRP
jgi:membrane protease YdiL (CAAX protease family)